MSESNKKSLFPGGHQGAMLMKQLVPELTRITKKLGKERVFEALTDDAKMEQFAIDVYAQLPINIKSKVSAEAIIPVIMSQKDTVMKRKSSQKKIAREAKKLGRA